MGCMEGGWNGDVKPKRERPQPTGLLNDTAITVCGDATELAARANNNISPHLLWDSDNDPIPPAQRINPDGSIAGQDCHLGRDVTDHDDHDGYAGFSFLQLDAEGVKLVEQTDSLQNGESPSCVKDAVTGLVWLLQSQNHVWGSATLQSYIAETNRSVLCGEHSWRLPTPVELSSLLRLEGTAPLIDTHYFPATAGGEFWTSAQATQIAAASIEATQAAWAVSFATGQEHIRPVTQANYVRLVSSGEQEDFNVLTPEVELSLSIPAQLTEGDSRNIVRFVVTRSDSTTAASYVVSLAGYGENPARLGSDAELVTSSIRFASGETRVEGEVAILGDTLPERPESEAFQLTLSNSAGVVLTHTQATILDDDFAEPVFRIEASSNEVTETDTEDADAVSLTITRVGGDPSVAASVELNTSLPSGLTAVPTATYGTAGDFYFRYGDEFVPETPLTLNFVVGEISKTVLLGIVGDNRIEGDEFLYASLSGASSAEPSSYARIAITDNDNDREFSLRAVGSAAFAEDSAAFVIDIAGDTATAVELDVARDAAGSAQDLTLSFAQRADALDGIDVFDFDGESWYVRISPATEPSLLPVFEPIPLSFTASQISKRITLHINPELYVAPDRLDESFTATLSASSTTATVDPERSDVRLFILREALNIREDNDVDVRDDNNTAI